MPTPEEITVIRAKAVSERTEAEKAILQEADHPGTDPKKTENMIPQSRFNEVNEELKAAKQALKDAEQKRLQEANDYKALWEKSEKERVELAPKAAQVDAYEKTLSDLLTSQIAEMPEDRRGLVPTVLSTQQKLDWIASNRAVLMAPKAFDIGAGQQGGNGEKPKTKVNLTDEEKQWADKAGMSHEEYAKNMQ